MAVPAQKLKEAVLLNEFHSAMSLAAMTLGASNSKAAQGGNIAIIDVRLQGKSVFREPAFSNSSSLPKAIKADFAPSVPPAHLGRVGIPNGNQHANHTEPKLFDLFKTKLPSLGGGFDEIIIASERDCCASCLKHTIDAITALVALSNMSSVTSIKFYVVEINSWRAREA